MKKITLILFAVIFFFSFLKAENNLIKKRVLFINSYHNGYEWSDKIEKAVKNTLSKSGLPIQYKRVEMDSKRNNTEKYKIRVALKVKNLIDKFKPDVIITSDDNAMKYIYMPFFYDKETPFIFTGVNVSAHKYGVPTKNLTGILEVPLVEQIYKEIRKYAKGDKIGFIKGESLSSRMEVDFFEKRLGKKIDKRLVSTVKQWKENYLDLQNNVDMLFIGSTGAVKDWDENKGDIFSFLKRHTKIPSGGWVSTTAKLNTLVYSIIPEEAGKWAGKTALKILQGKDISRIPIVENKKANIYINTSLAKKLNIIFPFDIIDNAVLIK